MKITRRDLEAFIKKECFFKNGKIYLENIEVSVDVKNNQLYVECEAMMGLLKFYFNGKKHVRFEGNCLVFSHPLIKFDDVMISEDGVEITFK